jgi:hypothetical protein
MDSSGYDDDIDSDAQLGRSSEVGLPPNTGMMTMFCPSTLSSRSKRIPSARADHKPGLATIVVIRVTFFAAAKLEGKAHGAKR